MELRRARNASSIDQGRNTGVQFSKSRPRFMIPGVKKIPTSIRRRRRTKTDEARTIDLIFRIANKIIILIICQSRIPRSMLPLALRALRADTLGARLGSRAKETRTLEFSTRIYESRVRKRSREGVERRRKELESTVVAAARRNRVAVARRDVRERGWTGQEGANGGATWEEEGGGRRGGRGPVGKWHIAGPREGERPARRWVTLTRG